MKSLKLICLLIALPISILAQEAKDLPSISYIYPAGMQRGVSANIIIAGTKFENVKELVGSARFENVEAIIVSGEGVKATLVESIIPSDRSRAVGGINEIQKILIERGLLDKSKANDKKAQTSIDFKAYPDLQKMRQEVIKEQNLFRLSKSTQASHGETLKVKITVAPDAKLGKRSLRVVCKTGVSNPIPFYVGDLPEYAEYSIRDKNLAVIRGAKGNIAAEVLAQEQAELNEREERLIQDITPPLTINGQIDLFESDFYRFKAHKGENFVAQVHARELIPFIADAVPAWFQATISIKNSAGKEIAYQDDFFQNPDPLLAFEIPKDDFYTLEIKDAIYRGREDFVYRITLGKFPLITRIYPLGGSVALQEISLIGSNLERQSVTIKPSEGLKELVSSKAGEKQGKLYFKADNLQSIDNTKATNLSPQSAKALGLSQAANSILYKNGDKHFYKFKTDKDTRIVVEVFARRLGSPLDSHLEILNSNLKHLHSNDDYEDPAQSLITHHADSKIDFTALAHQTYYIALRDTQNNASAEHAYRLCIYEPLPDFDIKASPSTINIAEGKSNSFKVNIFRANGFEFPIKVSLKNAPKGLSLSGGYIPANSDNISMVLSADKSLKVGIHDIQLEATAQIGNVNIKKIANPCEDMTQAFYYSHLVPAQSHQVYILPMDALHKYQKAYRIQADKKLAHLVPDSIKIPLGKEQRIYIGAYALAFNKTPFALEAELKDSSAGISISKIENTESGYFITLKSDPQLCKIGQSANLIIDIYTKKQQDTKAIVKSVRDADNSALLKIDTLKAIRYEIVAP